MVSFQSRRPLRFVSVLKLGEIHSHSALVLIKFKFTFLYLLFFIKRFTLRDRVGKPLIVFNHFIFIFLRITISKVVR